ncbi:MAG TPA: NAD(P)/FAD-dependent oxidoreductase, partial [Acidobacteriota bacterium]|nr:NAD(P)/FAD-dependent oxidoreductase [Acidobacteriota bacterium]
MYDVVVIGAGPSGSMAARLLGENGYSVVLLEEHTQPGAPVNCSGVIGIEAFSRYDLPTDPIIRDIDTFRFYSPGGATLQYCHPEPLAYAVNRARFDTVMAARAVAAGATLMTGSRATGIHVDRDGVRLDVHRRQDQLKSRFVVIATGAGPKLTAQVGLGSPRRYVLGAQTECETIALREVEIHLGQQIAPSNFAWVIPLQSGNAKIGLISDHDAGRKLREFLDSPALEGRILSRHVPIQCSPLPLDTIPRSYADRTLVIGEAAGQIKTITCGGIYYGLLAAEIAADVLHRALSTGRSNASMLSTYEKRWRALLDKELQIGLKLRTAFERFNDSRIEAL